MLLNSTLPQSTMPAANLQDYIDSQLIELKMPVELKTTQMAAETAAPPEKTPQPAQTRPPQASKISVPKAEQKDKPQPPTKPELAAPPAVQAHTLEAPEPPAVVPAQISDDTAVPIQNDNATNFDNTTAFDNATNDNVTFDNATFSDNATFNTVGQSDNGSVPLFINLDYPHMEIPRR